MDIIARSDFYVVVDRASCTACEYCLDRCLFMALKREDDSFTVNKDLCVGCGLCVSSCTTGALSLALKPAAEVLPPPGSEQEWRKERAEARMRMGRHN